mmetsp:Transcript_321/g.1113  ORF Transcript_321/g.1113 Transcript_321/m.1113 type:complete len:263 (-) Transcript_321:42-830(-)
MVAFAASTRFSNSESCWKVWPCTSFTLAEMSRSVGPNMASATRTTSMASLISDVCKSSAFCTGSAMMAAFSHSSSIPATRSAISSNCLVTATAASKACLAVLCSCTLTSASSSRRQIFLTSSVACSFAIGANPSTSPDAFATSRCAAVKAMFATLTMRSVSLRAPSCSSRNCSMASIASGAATMPTRSAASSTSATFFSRGSINCSSRITSCSSLWCSVAILACSGLEHRPASPGASDGPLFTDGFALPSPSPVCARPRIIN